jgi:hypothetical protein
MSSDEVDAGPPEGHEALGETVEGVPFGTASSRRTFFKGAALGTAAAAMYTGGRMAFAPLAHADPLGDLNCTANDVRIPGPGQIVNEPCACTGTFTAQVRFRLINNTGTDRYCVTVHLCDGIDEDGNVVVPAQDINIGTIPANFNDFKTVDIPNWPCGAGLVCFGPCGPGVDPDTGLADCSFPKGADCPEGECCTVISWNVRPNEQCPQDHNRIITSKCRRQQVCVQGRGETTIACPSSGCAVECGGCIDLEVCTSEPASEGPFIFELRSGTTLVERFPATGTTTDTCHTFNVCPTEDTTYFGRVISTQDDPDCVKDSPAVLVTVEQITPTITVSGNEGCTRGELTLTASPSGCESYAWSIDGVAAGTGNPFTYQPNADTVCHTVRVDVVCDGCEGFATTTISQCVQTTVGC